jgi:FAD/FMN-containing dehydrogenase
MNRIDAVDTLGATLTVQAGATLQAVQEAAAAAGFLFGMDLGARGSCQIGGNLATNAGGNGVVQHGMMREQTLGLEVVLADGTVLPMLRPMLKNNTGCDLKHVFIGSEGTLGIITQAVLTLRPASPCATVRAGGAPRFCAGRGLAAAVASGLSRGAGSLRADVGRLLPPVDRLEWQRGTVCPGLPVCRSGRHHGHGRHRTGRTRGSGAGQRHGRRAGA